MDCVGLFAGIGGIEVGLERAGIHASLLCEIDPSAQAVLRKRFSGIPIVGDVALLRALPKTDVLTAGFPCQDISQAGPKNGITGNRSGLASHIFRLLESRPSRSRPKWIVIENVSYIVNLHKGDAMSYLADSLEKLGYDWAYRIIDARAFGVPQRRLRMILVASRCGDPAGVLFSENVKTPPVDDTLSKVDRAAVYGFYWTEGLRGIGWTKNGVPTIKGGSTIGIPSPPAVWNPSTGEFGTIDIRDAERLQGFSEGWTFVEQSPSSGNKSVRWKQVGNAVCTRMAEWVGKRIVKSPKYVPKSESKFENGAWPKAARGKNGQRYAVEVSTWPVKWVQHPLGSFCRYPLKPLSVKAATGFYERALNAPAIRYPQSFLRSLNRHIKRMKEVEHAD